MRLTILGGGGFRVPLVFRAVSGDGADPAALGVDELVLYDVSAERLGVIGAVLEELRVPCSPRVRTTTDLTDAVRGADFVFSAIRVGGLAGRVCDERVAMAHGVIGQETTGAGGVCYGLRTVPTAVRVAETVAEHAPSAWVINFTNPAGMVTEAMRRSLGERVIGICDSPVGLFRRVARALEIDPADAVFDYAGLNHLGWLRAVYVDGADRLPELLADGPLLRRIEEGRLFGPEWLRTLGAIPNEYLWYWYFRTDALAAELTSRETRGEFLREQQEAFYAAAAKDPTTAYAAWEATRRQREETYMADSRELTGSGERDPYDLDGGGYDAVALAVMRAVARDEPSDLVLNVANRGTLPFLDDEAVVEVPCRIDAGGPRPRPVGRLDLHAQGLVTSMKAVERTTVEAALTGSRELAVRALATHPLVGAVPVARAVLDDQLAAVPELAAVIRRD
ncbi:6-phospho-beta-glucosidase [Nocardioides sp. KR10-350]|uniref:6-phospho-beta-glucosidase n=1 Tax=Nocardioides cheoyonin TaxID=3156615 RepID=UPI0032B39261